VTPDRWQKVKRITADALERAEGDRALYVEAEVEGDEDLRKEVLRLISGCENAEPNFLSQHPWSARAVLEDIESGGTSFLPGQVVCNRFEVVRFINTGGMGEVYEAWDTELRENVALKTIRPEIAAYPRIIESFKHEVKQARRISHRNICRVYDLFCHETADSRRVWFLTMELLSGPTLREHLSRTGRLELERALPLIEQMVAGLQSAHDLGIVHKDFKSNNVMLVDTGQGGVRVVITDFGLALQLSSFGASEATSPGIGTPDYMAPEQKAGGEVGFAADQYSLGVVMYEICTGVLPPRDARGVLAADAASLPRGRGAEARWETVIRRCLEVRPEDRFASVGEIVPALAPKRARPSSRWRIVAIASALALAGSAVLLALAAGRRGRLENLVQLTSGQDLSEGPSFSRDGRMIAYYSDRAEPGNLDIWVQDLASGTARRVTTDRAEDVDPSLSPDGKMVAFRSERNGGGIYLAGTNGEGERLLIREGRSPRFSPDGGRIAFWIGDKDPNQASGRLFWVPVAGGVPQPLAADSKYARQPVWSPDGRSVLFTGCQEANQPAQACAEWWVANMDGRLFNTHALAAVHAEGVWPIGAAGAWQGNTLLFSGMRGSARGLWEVTISGREKRVVGRPRPLTSGEDKEYSPALTPGGKIAFGRISFSMHVWRVGNALSGANRKAEKVTDDAEADYCPYISPNGRWLAFGRLETNGSSIWVKDMASGKETRAYSSGRLELNPLVDETGRTLVFEERDKEIPSIWIAAKGSAARRLCTNCGGTTGWFDGNRAIVYSAGLFSKLMIMDAGTGAQRELLGQPGSTLGDGNWSAENQFLLFTASSSDGLRRQIFAVGLPAATGIPSGPRVPITPASESSWRPRWSGDGKSVFYLSTRDGFACIWARRFDVSSGQPVGEPFEVAPYHNQRFSPNQATPRSFNLSVAGNSIYLSPAETTSTLWTGTLRPSGLFPWLR
jgi:Tol biopolymer transport system component